MRLADTPAPARAGRQADAVPGNAREPAPPRATPPEDQHAAGGSAAASTAAGTTDSTADSTVASTAFAAAVAAFGAGRDAVAGARDDLAFEDWPAPKRLAPHAVALAVTAYRDGVEAGTGKLVLLHDPVGQQGWTGTFRMVAQVHADVEAEMAADPLLGEVGWSWLTDALDLHAPGYAAASGTVTRVITEGYGAKEDEPPATGFELRASWCPADDEIEGTVVAWCDLLAAAAGLPAAGTQAIGPRSGDAAGPGPGARRQP